MIKATSYMQSVSPEERHAAAVLRIKADYDKVVDSKALYEAYEKESPFVDDRNQVLTLVFCVLVSWIVYVQCIVTFPVDSLQLIFVTPCLGLQKLLKQSYSLVITRPSIRTANTNPALKGHLVEAQHGAQQIRKTWCPTHD